MQSLTGNEPHLELGDTGEWVMQVQVRLYLLGYFREWPEGAYGMSTESAVRQVQSDRGLDNDGEVSQSTWEAILYLEQQAAIDYYWHSPYDALAQIQYDLEHPPAGGRTVSEDGQWQWDGSDWVAATESATQSATQTDGLLSEDGQWRWDGSDWQPATSGADNAARGSGGVAVAANSYAGQVSEDGQWRWDGSDWQPASSGVDGASGGGGTVVNSLAGQVSEDGQWRWDGRQWQAT